MEKRGHNKPVYSFIRRVHIVVFSIYHVCFDPTDAQLHAGNADSSPPPKKSITYHGSEVAP